MIKQRYQGFIQQSKALRIGLEVTQFYKRLGVASRPSRLLRPNLSWKQQMGLIGGAVLVYLLINSNVVYFMNTAQIKSDLEKQIHQLTQHSCIIKGPIQWRLTRFLCLEAQALILSSSSPFSEDLAVIKKLRFFPHWGSWFLGKRRWDVEISGLTLNLERMPSGYSNWENVVQQFTTWNSSMPLNAHPAVFSGLKIQDGVVNFQDERYKHHYVVQNLNVSLAPMRHALNGHWAPVTLKFNLEGAKGGVLGACSLQASYRFNTSLKQVEVRDLLLRTQLPNHSEAATLMGTVNVRSFLENPYMEGNLELKQFDLVNWLNKFQIKHALRFPKISELMGKFKYQDAELDVSGMTVLLPEHGVLEANFKFSPSLNIRMIEGQGTVVAKTLNVSPIELKQFKTSVMLKAGILDIAPIEFQLAKGKHQASMRIDYNSLIPKFNLTYLGEQFEIDTVLNHFGRANAIEGRTRLKTTLSSRGSTVEQLRKNLTGQAEVEIANGNVYGIDLLHLLKHAQSTIKSVMYTSLTRQTPRLNALLNAEMREWQEQARSVHPFSTPFESIRASALISNGTVNNPDLTVQHAQYTLEGKGIFNLNQDALHYRLFAHYTEPTLEASQEVGSFLKTTPLGIQVSGQFKNPVVHPDLEGYTHHALKFSEKGVFEKTSDKAPESKAFDHFVDEALQ